MDNAVMSRTESATYRGRSDPDDGRPALQREVDIERAVVTLTGRLLSGGLIERMSISRSLRFAGTTTDCGAVVEAAFRAAPDVFRCRYEGSAGGNRGLAPSFR
jgi:hypothetical protein